MIFVYSKDTIEYKFVLPLERIKTSCWMTQRRNYVYIQIRKAYRHIKLCRRLLLTKSKMVPKFCANLSFMFTESSSLLERYQLASELGFHAVECAFPYEYSLNDVVQAKTKANVDQILINTYPGNELFEKHSFFLS